VGKAPYISKTYAVTPEYDIELKVRWEGVPSSARLNIRDSRMRLETDLFIDILRHSLSLDI